MKISFINAVANLAEAVDADIEDIAAGMGLDSRIGPRFLRAGLGYGGSCFPKDVAAFHWVAQERGVDFQLLEEVRKINETQKEVFFNKVRSALVDAARQAAGRAGPGLQGRHRRHSRVARDRDDQEAAACGRDCDGLSIPRRWSARRKCCRPRANMKYAGDLYEAAKDADAVLILTDWKEFAAIGPGAAEPGHALPDRDRRAEPLQAARDAEPRIHLCERGQAGEHTRRRKASRARRRHGPA